MSIIFLGIQMRCLPWEKACYIPSRKYLIIVPAPWHDLDGGQSEITQRELVCQATFLCLYSSSHFPPGLAHFLLLGVSWFRLVKPWQGALYCVLHWQQLLQPVHIYPWKYIYIYICMCVYIHITFTLNICLYKHVYLNVYRPPSPLTVSSG